MTHPSILNLKDHIYAVNGDEMSEICEKHIFCWTSVFFHEQNDCKIAVFLENCLPLKKLWIIFFSFVWDVFMETSEADR